MDQSERSAIVRCQACHPRALLPRKMTEGSSGYDLSACLDEELVLEPGQRHAVPTGLILAIPAGYEGVLRPRSGLALKQGITLLNSPGTIDSDYRGEVRVILINHGREAVRIAHGDRIAQLVLQTVPEVAMEWGTIEDETARGAGGFGHTGFAAVADPASGDA